MAAGSDKLFFNHVIMSLSGESDDDNNIMLVGALPVHDHEENQSPRFRARYWDGVQHLTDQEASHD
jgi:hypothetical protein